MNRDLISLGKQMELVEIDYLTTSLNIDRKIANLAISLDYICDVLKIPIVSAIMYEEDFRKHNLESKLPVVVGIALKDCYKNLKNLYSKKDLSLYLETYSIVKDIYEQLKRA